jgi:hypothetical protein
VLRFGSSYCGRKLVFALLELFGEDIEPRQGVFERSDEGFGVELALDACRTGFARGGYGAVGEGFDEILDDEAFVLTLCERGMSMRRFE